MGRWRKLYPIKHSTRKGEGREGARKRKCFSPSLTVRTFLSPAFRRREGGEQKHAEQGRGKNFGANESMASIFLFFSLFYFIFVRGFTGDGERDTKAGRKGGLEGNTTTTTTTYTSLTLSY